MAQQLYILNENNEAQPVTWGEYDQWEEGLPRDARCALGKRIKTTASGGHVVVTVFLMCPIGYYGRRPQLWLTMVLGDTGFDERRYSSHRAALQGHASAVKEIRRYVPRIARVPGTEAAASRRHEVSPNAMAAS